MKNLKKDIFANLKEEKPTGRIIPKEEFLKQAEEHAELNRAFKESLEKRKQELVSQRLAAEYKGMKRTR